MTTLSITTKGQITLKRELLQHMGIEQGQRVEVLKLPNGELKIRAEHPTQAISDVFGLLKDKTSGKIATIEEINHAIAAGWASDEN